MSAPLMEALVLVGSIGTLVATYYAFLLSRETGHEKYWLMLAVSAFFFAIHQWLLIPWEAGIIAEQTRLVLEQISVVISSALFGYSVHGLHKAMTEVRRRVE